MVKNILATIGLAVVTKVAFELSRVPVAEARKQGRREPTT